MEGGRREEEGHRGSGRVLRSLGAGLRREMERELRTVGNPGPSQGQTVYIRGGCGYPGVEPNPRGCWLLFHFSYSPLTVSSRDSHSFLAAERPSGLEWLEGRMEGRKEGRKEGGGEEGGRRGGRRGGGEEGTKEGGGEEGGRKEGGW